MKKLLEIDIVKAVGSIIAAPIIFWFFIAVVFQTWVVNLFLFGSVTAAIIISVVFAVLPLIITTWYSVIGILALMRKLDS